MTPPTGGVGRWTQYFAAASAVAMVALQTTQIVGAAGRTVVVISLFGAVLPMVFGMAYLLLPAYVGRTLATPWLPGIHLMLAYVGAGLLAADAVIGGHPTAFLLGSLAWTLGVCVFVVALGRTVVPAVLEDPTVVVRSADRPQRSTRLATVMLPVAIGYLLIGTVSLLSTAGFLTDVVGATFQRTVHYYGTGVVTLLILALGARLLIGFFHVRPPKYPTWVMLTAGAIAPAVLAGSFWQPPWFYVGAGLELVALASYTAVVGTVATNTDRRRIGLYGIVAGSIAGLSGGILATLTVTGGGSLTSLAAHRTAMIDGFVLLTIIGYASQFFPVTNQQFRGASRQTALASIGLLIVGVTLSVVGMLSSMAWMQLSGAALELLGTITYAYLLGRRLLGPL